MAKFGEAMRGLTVFISDIRNCECPIPMLWGWVLRMRLCCVSLVPTLSTIEEGLGTRLVLCVTCDVFCHEILFHHPLFHRQVKGG